MVSNTSGGPASADVFLDFGGQRHPSAPLSFAPYETKILSVTALLSALNTSPSEAPEGGITIVAHGSPPTLIAQGKVFDAVTGFSTTLEFPDPARQQASALHASGVPVGTPTQDSPFRGMGNFVPRVVVRNLLSAPQTVTITLEYPTGQFGPQGNNEFDGAGGEGTGTLALGPFQVDAYTSQDFELGAALSQLPLPLPYASVRLKYSGPPGSLVAQASSVDASQDLVIDSRLMNEGDGWAGSGANPWHLDIQTESILFLTNMSDQPARIGFVVTANGVHYYLTRLTLSPHETRAIDLRQLRDAQGVDFRGNQIPAQAGDGSVNWIRIDNLPVMGRVVVIERHQGLASNYDCGTCPYPEGYVGLTTTPASASLNVGGSVQCYATAEYADCNGNYTYSDVTAYALWTSSNTSVATASAGLVKGAAGGTATIRATYTDWFTDASGQRFHMTYSDTVAVTVGAYPVNFRQTSGYATSDGVLHFAYAWSSSTGNTADLSNCTINEIVTYPGTAATYYWPLPPWAQGTPNPTIAGVAGTIGSSVDAHGTGVFAPPPYASKSFNATQTYNYTCYGGALKGTLLGPLNIARSVSGSGSGPFTYKGTKSGVSASCTVGLNCANE